MGYTRVTNMIVTVLYISLAFVSLKSKSLCAQCAFSNKKGDGRGMLHAWIKLSNIHNISSVKLKGRNHLLVTAAN
jgi:hypothetical protein